MLKKNFLLLASLISLSVVSLQTYANSSVAISAFAFAPISIEVPVGSLVIWTNQDGANHSVIGDAGSFASDTLTQGQSFSHTFNMAGTYKYHCGFHKYMTGTVVVK